jgi:hypothetical protein
VTELVTTHRATLDNGPLVVDGELQWLSATIITKGDERAEGGCLRRLWYYAVGGKEEPGSASQGTGLKVHDEIERHVTTGEMTLGPIAITAKAQIPKPGPDLLVEHALERGLITCAGVPVVGHIDLVSFRGVNVGASDFGDVQDPPGTIEIRDWKTSSDFRWAKTGDELRENVQMLTYGRYGLERWNPAFVRLTHVYIHTKKRLPAINRSTGPMRPDEIRAGWEGVEVAGRKIRLAVRADRAEDVDANTRACGAFRGCPHRSYCKAANHDSLASMWGEELAEAFERLIVDETAAKADETAEAPQPEGENMSLLELLNTDAIESAPDPAAAKKAALLAEMAKIEAEEAAAAAARAAKAAKVTVPEGFAEALDTIARAFHDDKPIGMPPLGGEAAKVYAAAKGLNLEGQGYAGSGALGGTAVITDPTKIVELARRCEAQGKVRPPKAGGNGLDAGAMGLLPPDAPASDPAKASAGPKGGDATKGGETVDPPAPPPAKPVTDTNAADAAQLAAQAPDAPEAKPKRAKKSKADGAAQTGPADVTMPDGSPFDKLVVFVDAIPSRDFASLDQWFRDLVATLCRNEGPTCVDPRLVPDSSGMAFGRWKGAIAALARAKPPAPDLYVVVRPDELMSAALEGLRQVADLYVVGVR